MRGPRILEVWKIGIVNYLDALKLQEKLVADRKICKIPDTLLSLQHPPTYTLRIRRTDHNLLMPVIEKYRSRASSYTKGRVRRGVWVGDRKIGAIGVRISYGITSHGLAFNIDPDLKYFKHIVPCGIAYKEVTSLRNETGTVLPPEEVIHEQLISCFARLFGYSAIT
ncbi:hypothetical protein REPUB_Repub11eG0089900 [Reevesia pubescens]